MADSLGLVCTGGSDWHGPEEAHAQIGVDLPDDRPIRSLAYKNAEPLADPALAPAIGYDQAADVAKESFRTGRTVRQVARDRKLMDDAALDKALDPRRMTDPQADMIGSQEIRVFCDEPEVVTIPAGEALRLDDGRPLPVQGPADIILPPGTSRMTTGRLVKDGTYRHVDAEPLPWHAALTRIPVGMETAADISDLLCFVNRRIVAFGPPAETFTPHILHETFGGELMIVDAGDHAHVHGGGHHGHVDVPKR